MPLNSRLDKALHNPWNSQSQPKNQGACVRRHVREPITADVQRHSSFPAPVKVRQ